MAVIQRDCLITAHEQLSDTLWRIELAADAIAPLVQPGQFVHVRLPRFEEHVLRRPFSVYRNDIAAGTIALVYRVVGEGTGHMTSLACGESLDLIGPTGSGWTLPDSAGRALIIGAGVGAAPVYALAAVAQARGCAVQAVLGAQTHAELVFEEDFRALGIDVVCTTDDGSYAIPGFCTDAALDLVKEAEATGNPFDYCAVCGPHPVMRIAAAFCNERGIACEVSMERRMACGIGACLSCVVDTADGKKRSCIDGPVFDAREVEW